MLAHHTYAKGTPESKAVRSAFMCSGLLICLIATLVVLDVAVRGDPTTLSIRQTPDIKAAFVQPKTHGQHLSKGRRYWAHGSPPGNRKQFEEQTSLVGSNSAGTVIYRKNDSSPIRTLTLFA